MNHRYALTLKLDDGIEDTQNIGIQHLSVGRRNAWNESVVDRVDKPMVWMFGAQWTIDSDGDYLV